MIKIITDSTSDLPEEIIKKYNIRVVPLTVTVDGKDYVEGVEITPQEFYQKMYRANSLPKTSQPSTASFAKVFKELSEKGQLLCLTMSSKLSGTYQSACIAKEMSRSEVTVFDSLGGSLGQGIQILRAARLSSLGFSLEQIVEKLRVYREEMQILILLNTLENIVKGGRLSKFQGTLASVLNIKILLEGLDGAVHMLEKVRGQKKAIQRILDIIGERRKDFSDRVFGITHVDNPDDAEFFKKSIIERYNPKEVLVNQMSATLATYAGKGGLIISF